MEGSPKRDVLLMGFMFLLLFVSYSAVQNLETSLHPDGGLGSLSLGLIYGSLVISAFFVPRIIELIGCRCTMLGSLVGYWVYVASNLSTSRWVLLAASVFLGFASATLWVAESVYLVLSAREHARITGENLSAVVGSFSGIFWGIYAANQVIGNAITFIICLVFAPTSTPPLSPPASFSILLPHQANFTNHGEPVLSAPENALGGSSALFFTSSTLLQQPQIDGHTAHILLLTFLVLMTSSSFLGFRLRSRSPTSSSLSVMDSKPSEDESREEGGMEDGEIAYRKGGEVEGGRVDEEVVPLINEREKSSLGFFHLLQDRRMLLILPLLVYSGLELAFISGDFTHLVVETSLGPAWIGGSMSIYGIFNVIACLVCARFSAGLVSIVIITVVGSLCHVAMVVGLLVNCIVFNGGDVSLTTIIVASILWGIGDAAISSQISALLPLLFPTHMDHAYALWKMSRSAATSLLFFASPYFFMEVKLLILFVVSVVQIYSVTFLLYM